MKYKSIKNIQDSLLKKEAKAVDIVDNYLENISENDSKLNAFLTVTDEKAYELARKYDQLISENTEGLLKQYPLLGTVVSYKDLFLTEGIRTTAGSNVLASYIPVYSATVVKKLESAGAIIIGKTNCDAWAHGASGENSDFGPTKNPWNLEYVPGGSSSGSAVSVASGMSVFSMGTDTGGSIRQPANFTGVYGFKPTYGAVSRYGVVSMSSSLDSIGHFSLTAADSEKIFIVTKGADGFDANIKDIEMTPKEKMTLGIPKEYFIDGIDPEVRRSVEEAINIYEKMGYRTKEVSLPNTKHAISVYYILQPAEVSSNLGRYDGIRFGNGRDSFGAEAKRRIMLGTFVLSSGYYDAYYKKASSVRTLIIKEFDKVFEEVDLLIAPVSPTSAFKIGEKADDPLKMYLSDILTVPANIAGIPGLSVPFGKTESGLPLGFQLMGPRFSENLIFKAAKDFEKETSFEYEFPM